MFAGKSEEAFPDGRFGGAEGDGPSRDRRVMGSPSDELNVLMGLMLGRRGGGTE